MHRKGTRTKKPHPARVREFARLRAVRWQRETGYDVAQARAALAAFDLAEYEKLRAWLAEHGPVLWGGQRPDGSLRGDTYAIG